MSVRAGAERARAATVKRRLWVAALLTAVACSAHGDEMAPLRPLMRDVTVVAFWATWCPPCRAELPKIEKLHDKYKGDAHVAVVVVSVDRSGKAAEAQKVAQQLGVTAPQLTDGKKLYFRFFGGDDTDVPRLAIFDRKQHGVETLGAEDGESADDFVRRVSAAVEAVRAGTPAPPGWKPLRPRR